MCWQDRSHRESVAQQQWPETAAFIPSPAVCELSFPVTLAENIKLVPLDSSKLLSESDICTAIGWSSPAPDARSRLSMENARVLQKVVLKVLDPSDCNNEEEESKKPRCTTGMICASTRNKDICLDDTGGPLICSGVDFGVAAFEMDCGPRNTFSIFQSLDTEVSSRPLVFPPQPPFLSPLLALPSFTCSLAPAHSCPLRRSARLPRPARPAEREDYADVVRAREGGAGRGGAGRGIEAAMAPRSRRSAASSWRLVGDRAERDFRKPAARHSPEDFWELEVGEL
ncbi:Phenoloxidase-activating factor 2 [Gryllus bimaculatus]|nr:Phenoloxidase-activating factor 2 [Gryllus bimaculatus]